MKKLITICLESFKIVLTGGKLSLNLTISLHILISSQTDKKPPFEKEAKHMTLVRLTQSGRYFDRRYRSENDVINNLLQLDHSFGIVSIVLK
jgi:hypothetical protein